MPSDSEVPRRPSAIPPKPPHRPGNAGGKSEPGEPSSRRDRFIAGAIARLGLVVMLLAGLHYYIGARMIEGGGLRGSESTVAWLALWGPGGMRMPSLGGGVPTNETGAWMMAFVAAATAMMLARAGWQCEPSDAAARGER